MKNKYFLYLFILIIFVVAALLYIIDIPVPSKIMTEKYSLELK
tara:strand:+ start:101 stop:229 length:129 start_codon:yes stop_codon:yes gene_type:complete